MIQIRYKSYITLKFCNKKQKNMIKNIIALLINTNNSKLCFFYNFQLFQLQNFQ